MGRVPSEQGVSVRYNESLQPTAGFLVCGVTGAIAVFYLVEGFRGC